MPVKGGKPVTSPPARKPSARREAKAEVKLQAWCLSDFRDVVCEMADALGVSDAELVRRYVANGLAHDAPLIRLIKKRP